ncbi:hypothetical protein CASFOL_003107 [Castilleja foliolosa]|uniref:Response regulatory domain-containing protein n=1 Tax=Castilleja foliolosa TaxID=1961234 RepID=A0ABD3EJL4_9LAMI
MAGFSSSAGPICDSSKGKELAIDYDEDVPFQPHVLVVDDEYIFRELHKSKFEKHSCIVTTVNDGSQALEVLGIGDGKKGSGIDTHSRTVDLVVCTNDCMLPGMSGYELLVKMKKSPTTKDVPVVFVSTSDQDRINECMEAGAVDFILKPLKSADVENLVKLVTDVRGR